MGVLALALNSTATAYTESPAAAQTVSDGGWADGGWWILPLGLVVFLLFWSSRAARLVRLPRFPWTFSAGTGYVFVLGALFAGAVAAQITLAIIGPAPEDADGAIRTLTIVQLVSLSSMGIVLLAMPGWWRRPLGQEDTRPGWIRSAAFGLFALVVFWPMVQATLLAGVMLRAWLTGEPASQFAHDTLVMLDEAGGSGWRWGLLALIVLVVPLVEETIYRGLLQESLRRHLTLTNGSVWGSIVVSSILFTLMHGGVATPEGLVSLLLLSLGLGWAFARTGRLVTPVVMHAGFNAANLLLASLG